jgi:hypothetical protein
MARKPYPSRTPSLLRAESLEDRRLLAVAAFEIHLYEDVEGQPGAEIAGDTLEAGDTFFMEITAQEFHPSYHGLQSVALDIAWNPAVFAEIDDPFDLSQIITSNLPMYRSGRLDNAAGQITNLAGSAFRASDVGRAIGDGVAERFALLHFQALQPSDASRIYLQPGRSQIVTVPTATPGRFEMDFERQMITVVASDDLAPPQTSAAPAPNDRAASFTGPTLVGLIPPGAPVEWLDVWLTDPNGDGEIDLGDFGAINAHFAERTVALSATQTAAPATLSAVDALFAASGNDEDPVASKALDDDVLQALMFSLAVEEEETRLDTLAGPSL